MRWDSLASEVTAYGLDEGGEGVNSQYSQGIFFIFATMAYPAYYTNKIPLQPIK
jgi:hypothetical protein